MEVNDAPGGFYLLSFALQQAFGRNLAQLATTKAAMIALSQQLGYNLTCVVVGVPSGQAGPFVVNSIQLATPTLVAATGSGASGTLALSWGAITNANAYILDRATNSGFTAGVTLGVYNGPLLVFNDSGLTAATVYYYRLRAHDTNAVFTDSAYSTANATSHT